MAVFLNDRFLDDHEARLPITDLAIQRAYAVFDFFRTVGGKPLFLDDYIDRFYHSAAGLCLQPIQPPETLKSIIPELIERSGLLEAGVRLQLTGGISPDGFSPAEPNLILSCKPLLVAGEVAFEKGIRVLSYEFQRELPEIKSINYLTAIRLKPYLTEKGADEVLYHKNGLVTEFPRANVFAVTQGGALVTPAENMLPGITRKQVLALARDIMPVEVRDLPLAELKQAAEIFLTSTTKRLMPVLALDGQVVGGGRPGAFTRRLNELFIALERETV